MNPLVHVEVDGHDGRHYGATGRLMGYVKVRGIRKVWLQAPGFDLLFDREDVVEVKRVQELWGEGGKL